VIEDFVPLTANRALITMGRSYRELNFIAEASYEFGAMLGDFTIRKEGKYLRLGHERDGEVIYSEGWRGPHQPFQLNGNRYCSDGAPDAKLYRDGELLIDHWPGVAEVCNAWVDEFIWFEARDEKVPAPDGWWICRADLKGGNIEMLFPGANPCMFDGNLYYGLWNGQAFDLARTDRRHCLPADPHLQH
jgi:hypothetical protein